MANLNTMESRGTSAGRCIVCHRSQTWAAGLRRELHQTGVSIDEVPSLSECLRQLERFPASILVLDADHVSFEDLLLLLNRLRHSYPDCRTVVRAPHAWDDQSRLLREAGAIHVVTSVRQLDVLARIVKRHVDAAPEFELTLTERLTASLPWNP